ncbi:hypothetical protein F1B92_02065 [Campylobacter sp. FMV-PI01]|uniref:Uncharacterized protein n=1 Tax=Campylobacter portucalensis TaxID=2608384 RepID=A0A6L5WFV0_9BACT|nr:hypothetical protein [Campylobacter portucalensis]MSN95990.1 hypothetical protein [Campylobacter portucalensis]
MKWLIDTIGGYIGYYVVYLVKKIGIKTAKLIFFIPLYTALVIFMISFAGYAILFMMKIWNLIRDNMPKAFDYSFVGGSYGGLSNSTIISSAMAFLHECGLAVAFTNAISLFISILSLFFALQLYRAIAFITNTITGYLKDLSYIM